MGKHCWMCGVETALTDLDFGDHECENCKVTISIYNPDKPDWKPENKSTEQEWLNKEEKVPILDVKTMSPFFKKGMLQEGAVGVIKTPFLPSGKFLNPTGEVDFDGVVIKISLNGTSLRDIASAYGINSDNWVGKQIVYSVEDIENKKTNALYRACNVFRAFK